MLHVGVVPGAGLSVVDIAAARDTAGARCGRPSTVARPDRVNGGLVLPGR